MLEITDQLLDKIERALSTISIDLTVEELDEIRDVLDKVLDKVLDNYKD
jgi:FtsZ-binding cell division protein ZapB